MNTTIQIYIAISNEIMIFKILAVHKIMNMINSSKILMLRNVKKPFSDHPMSIHWSDKNVKSPDQVSCYTRDFYWFNCPECKREVEEVLITISTNVLVAQKEQCVKIMSVLFALSNHCID
jgi:hypothetical protein